MTARAHAEYDLLQRAVVIHAAAGDAALSWEPTTFVMIPPGESAAQVQPLTLPEDVARAVYEALADHYGHSGHDTRALRKDYDAERARVDKLLAHLIA